MTQLALWSSPPVEAPAPPMPHYVIAQQGIVGKHPRRGPTALYHAIRVEHPAWSSAEAFTNWDHLPLHHPIAVTGDEAFPFTTTLCGATLRQDLKACWVAGTQVTCPRCAALLPERFF